MNISSKNKSVDLPRPRHWLYLLGPAFVWAATAQGSGELIWWPYLVARYGGAFLMLLVPAATIQFFVNKEVSRYTAVTGKGIWRGFVSIGKWYSLPLFILCFVNFLWFGGYATAGGSSLFEVLAWPSWSQKAGSLFWGYVLVVGFSAIMFFSKKIYQLIEVLMRVVTAITIIGLVTSAILVGNMTNLREFVGALFNWRQFGVGVNWAEFDNSKLITGLVFAGMGGFLNLMYSYWMKDKGIGVAKYAGKISGMFSGAKDKGQEENNFLIRDSKGNRQKWQAWVRYLNIDSGLAVVINLVTIMLTSFLAFVLLWPERNYPEGWSITVAQSVFFESSFGSLGRILFLIVAAAFLVDTWLALADGVSRQFADFCFSSWGARGRLKTENQWYNLWLVFLIGVTLVTMPLASPGALMNLVGVVSVFGFAFYIPALWYLNYIKVPRSQPNFVRPKTISAVWLGLVWLVYTGLAIWYVVVSMS